MGEVFQDVNMAALMFIHIEGKDNVCPRLYRKAQVLVRKACNADIRR